jgi:hypothetical protein
LVEACKSAIEKCPGMEIGQPPYGTVESDDVFAELSEQGYAVSKTHINCYPQKPEEPKAEDFGNRADYEEAQSEYYSRYMDYVEANNEVEPVVSGRESPTGGYGKCQRGDNRICPVAGGRNAGSRR